VTRSSAHPGFTLIEVLVILAIVSLIAGIGFPAVEKAMRRQAFVEAANRVDVALHGARAEALRQDQAVGFGVAVDGHGFGVGEAMERLVEPLAVQAPDGPILFYGDGSSTGGRLALTDRRWERHWQVRRNTGEIGEGP
jgi:general secretion pathway protein H